MSLRLLACSVVVVASCAGIGIPDAVDAARDRALPIDACGAMNVEAGVDVGGYQSDRYTWRDARCEPRSAALVHNDARDPSGHFGGIARELTYRIGDVVRTCLGSFDDHPGF